MTASRLSGIEVQRSSSLILLGLVFLKPVLITKRAQVQDSLLAWASKSSQPLPKEITTNEFPVIPKLAELGEAFLFDSSISPDCSVICAQKRLQMATAGSPSCLRSQQTNWRKFDNERSNKGENTKD